MTTSLEAPRSSVSVRSSLLGLVLSSLGCLAQSYQISAPELERIARLPAEERGERVRVTQQTSFDSDLTGLDAPDSSADWALLLATDVDGHHQRRRYRPLLDLDSSAADDDDADGAAAEALATAVVVVAAAATAAVSIGITEGARFDGWMDAPIDHPVLLVDPDGQRRWSRLETLTTDDVRGVDHAVLADFDGELQRLDRHPLDRTGFVYQLEFGAEPAPFEGPSLAVSGRGGIGFMPAQHYGFLLGAAFSTASDSGPPGPGPASSILSFDHRLFLQLEAWPLHGGRWHLGPYAELGYAWALTDDAFGSRRAEAPMLALGAALQLDWTTRLALTLRAGAAWLPSIDRSAALASDGYRLTPGLTLGVSIY